MLPAMRDLTDILVIGGGVMGLWGAVKAADAGLRVTVVDCSRIGAGASSGLMGAMFPWMPDRWDEKKQFQYDALTTLPTELLELEQATGLSAGFRRSGRIIPLPKPHLKTIALRHEADARTNWHQGGHCFFWHVVDTPPAEDYIDPEFAGAGHVYDTLAARLAPRALIALLKTWLSARASVRLIEETAIACIDPDSGRAELADGREILFSHALVAAGVESFPMLESLMPSLPKPLGQGIKGQAALLAAKLDPDLPVAFLDGLYIVPHEDGRVAVGSTSESHYSEPASTDQQLDEVINRARALVPALRDAPVLERWAGLRPKAIGRDPMIGPVPGRPNVIALTGGFKISFGMAHKLAAAAMDYALGRAPVGLPANFTLAGQIEREMGVRMP
jgi:glycine oxidase